MHALCLYNIRFCRTSLDNQFAHVIISGSVLINARLERPDLPFKITSTPFLLIDCGIKRYQVFVEFGKSTIAINAFDFR